MSVSKVIREGPFVVDPEKPLLPAADRRAQGRDGRGRCRAGHGTGRM